MMLAQVRYWTKLTQSGIFLVQYQTKIWNAGMPMPALVSSMPMPSYARIAFPYVNLLSSNAKSFLNGKDHNIFNGLEEDRLNG
jgi:hypothetical protein